MNKYIYLASFLVITSLNIPAFSAAVEKPYSQINLPASVAAPKSPVVVEFFSYGCPHCAKLAPVFSVWAEKQGNTVTVIKVPVGFHKQWVPLQRLFYALEALHLEKELGPKVYESIHINKTQLYTDEDVFTWAVEHAIDKERFKRMYFSFGIDSKISKANQLIKDYQVDGVPFVTVNSKFHILNDKVHGPDELVSSLDVLLKQK